MNIKNIIGTLMLVIFFGGIYLISAENIGYMKATIGTLISLVVTVYIGYAVHLLEE